MRILLTAAVCAALAAPAAQAHPAYHYAGRCGVHSIQSDVLTGPYYEGVLAAAVVATDAAGLPAPAVPVTVRCTLHVEGTEVASLAAAGPGAAVAVSPLRYLATPDHHVELCEHVVVAGDTHLHCRRLTSLIPEQPYPLPDEIPPGLWPTVDAIVCPAVLAELHRRGVPGVNEEGDVDVHGEPFWDCPPYDAGG